MSKISEYIIQNFNNNAKQLAKDCNCSIKYVYFVLRKNNITKFKSCKSHKSSEYENRVQYIKEYHSKLTNKELAERLNCSISTIREIKKVFNIQPTLDIDETFYNMKELGFSKYSISKNGIVINDFTKHIKKFSINTGGYYFINIVSDDGISKNKPIHILLAKMFIPNPDPQTKIEINHKDGNKLNYSLDNLEWVTKSENALHAHRLGLSVSKKGEQSSKAKYTEQDVRNVCELIVQGYTYSYIMKIYPQYSYYFIKCLKEKRAWRHITCEYF